MIADLRDCRVSIEIVECGLRLLTGDLAGSSAIRTRNPQSALSIRNPHSQSAIAIGNPHSQSAIAIRNPHSQSAIRNPTNPQSSIGNPHSCILSP